MLIVHLICLYEVHQPQTCSPDTQCPYAPLSQIAHLQVNHELGPCKCISYMLTIELELLELITHLLGSLNSLEDALDSLYVVCIISCTCKKHVPKIKLKCKTNWVIIENIKIKTYPKLLHQTDVCIMHICSLQLDFFFLKLECTSLSLSNFSSKMNETRRVGSKL